MHHGMKRFIERLNKCLDEVEAPSHTRERAVILSKLIHIPKQQARSLLEGHQIPNHDILQKIANEFEVNTDWLYSDE
jgi:hypothetical protein